MDKFSETGFYRCRNGLTAYVHTIKKCADFWPIKGIVAPGYGSFQDNARTTAQWQITGRWAEYDAADHPNDLVEYLGLSWASDKFSKEYWTAKD